MEKEKIHSLIEKIEDLPTLPSIATQVMSIIEDDRSTSSDLAKVIKNDIPLTGKLLKIANSAFYGRRSQISTLVDAVNLIGYNSVSNVVMSISVIDIFEKRRVDGPINKEDFWRHSIACGICARALARKIGYRLPEEAFTAGIIHDIGRLIIEQYFPEQFKEIVNRVVTEEISFLKGETDVLGVDHSIIGKWLLDKWNLPKGLKDAVWFHHQHLKSFDKDNSKIVLSKIVNVANTICQNQMLSTSTYDNVPFLKKETWEIFGLKEENIIKIAEGLRSDVNLSIEDLGLKITKPESYFSVLQKVNKRLGKINVSLNESNIKLSSTIKQLSFIYSISNKLQKALGIEEILKTTVKDICLGLKFSRGFCYLLNDKGKLIEGIIGEVIERDEKPADKEEKSDRGELIFLDYKHEFTKFKDRLKDFQPPKIIAIPIHINGKKIGGIAVDRCSNEYLENDKELFTLKTLSNSIGQALRRAQMYAELNKQAEELVLTQRKYHEAQSEKLESMGKLATNVAHEMNDPLQAINSFVSSTIENLGEDNENTKKLKLAKDCLATITGKISQFLHLYKKEIEIKDEVDVNSLIERVVAFLNQKLSQNKISIEKGLSEKLTNIKGSPEHLYQAFNEFIMFATKSMQEGGTIKISTRREERYVVVRFQDNGFGIPEKDISHIFEPFHKDKSGKESNLSAAYLAIKAHKGDVKVKSANGKGTVYAIFLPIYV